MPIVNPAPSACVTASLAHPSSLQVQPITPHAGSLFRVTIFTSHAGVQPNDVSASVAGEPLHFHIVGDSLVAIAAVPVDSTKGVNITLRCNSDVPIVTRIRTQRGAYALEKLRVAPQFSAIPDSALSARMSREAKEAATVSRESHNTPRLWNAPFAKPRATRITSAFGGGRIFNGEVTSRHMGTDFAGAVGEPVRAANRGIVRLIGAFYLGGNVVYIDHGEGLVTAYLHLSTQLVAVGDTVAQGAIIGKVGATGRVTGPHLHFIARYGQITVDPLTLFAQR